MYLRMAEINYEMQNSEDDEQQMEKAKEFFKLFIPFFNSMEAMLDKLRDVKQKLESVLEQ